MKHKGTHHEGQNKARAAVPQGEARRLGSLFKKHGVYDGRIFCSADKVTYTFVSHKEVISLHFDRARKEIYYQGHNIRNLKLNAKEIQHLKQLKLALGKEATASHFISAFEEVLNDYLGNLAISK